MVKNLQQNNIEIYQCEECGLKYKEKGTAEKCELWCREHKSCNLEIIKEAIEDGDARSS